MRAGCPTKRFVRVELLMSEKVFDMVRRRASQALDPGIESDPVSKFDREKGTTVLST